MLSLYLQPATQENTDSSLAEFDAGRKIDVYVLLDERVEQNGTVPTWLGSWNRTDMTAQTDNDVTFVLYKRHMTRERRYHLVQME